MTALMWLALVAVSLPDANGPDEKGKKVAQALQGEWVIERAEALKQEEKEFKSRKVVVTGDTLTVHAEEKMEWLFKLGAGGPPAEIDLYEGKVLVARSIYRLDGDTLTLCVGLAYHFGGLDAGSRPVRVEAGDRPTAFDSRQGVVLVLKRSK